MKSKDQNKVMFLKDRRLARELGGIIFSLFVIFMGAMIAIPSLIIKSQTKKSYYEMAQQIVISRSDELTKWIDIYVNDLKNFSEEDAAASGNIQDYVAWLSAHKNLVNAEYDDFFFCDKNAVPYHLDGRIGQEGDYRSKDYHHAIMFNGEEYFIAKVEVSEKTGKYVIPVSRAVKDKNGKVFGYVTALLDMDQIAAEIASYKVGSEGYFF